MRDGRIALALAGVSGTARPATLVLRVGVAAPLVRRLAAGESHVRLGMLVPEPGATVRGRLVPPRPGMVFSGRALAVLPRLPEPIPGALEPDGTFLVEGLPAAAGEVRFDGAVLDSRAMLPLAGIERGYDLEGRPELDLGDVDVPGPGGR